MSDAWKNDLWLYNQKYGDAFTRAVEKLYHWQYSRTDCFTDLLFDLFKKSDQSNWAKLGMVFPTESLALQSWENASDYGDDLFRHYGFMFTGLVFASVVIVLCTIFLLVDFSDKDD